MVWFASGRPAKWGTSECAARTDAQMARRSAGPDQPPVVPGGTAGADQARESWRVWRAPASDTGSAAVDSRGTFAQTGAGMCSADEVAARGTASA